MLEFGKVQARGQVTIPREVRRRAGIKPGDTLTIEVVGPGELKVRVLPTMTLKEMWERFRIEGPVDWAKEREAAEAEQAEEFIRKLRQH